MRSYKKIAYTCVIIILSSCFHLQETELKELIGTNVNDKKFQSLLDKLTQLAAVLAYKVKHT